MCVADIDIVGDMSDVSNLESLRSAGDCAFAAPWNTENAKPMAMKEDLIFIG